MTAFPDAADGATGALIKDPQHGTDGPFSTPDESTYYGGDHRGYTDYPALGRGSGR
ncbi:hypothetical protein ABZ532_13900 [Streptomyces sp. NPDC019396]|uniref:hypothetical protein n=1 Tax=Streptomyces sp. NPDC019396 TaxID=3154687 RepID=UPI0033E8EA04